MRIINLASCNDLLRLACVLSLATHTVLLEAVGSVHLCMVSERDGEIEGEREGERERDSKIEREREREVILT